MDYIRIAYMALKNELKNHRVLKNYSNKWADCLYELKKNEKLHNAYEGKRCFILGNGPSLKQLDFSLLSDEYTFSVNQLPRNERFPELKTSFHAWADARFFNLDLTKSEDQELLDVMKKVNSANNTPLVFYEITAKEIVEKTGLDKELNIYYFAQTPMDFQTYVKHNQFDPTKPIPDFSTVVHTLICIAVYMGFKEIYLLGCDCSGFINTAQAKLRNAESAEYGYKISDNEKKRMEKVANQTSIRNELLWYVNIFDTYKVLDDYCKKQGVKLYNATPGGLLEVIDRVDYMEVLKRK